MSHRRKLRPIDPPTFFNVTAVCVWSKVCSLFQNQKVAATSKIILEDELPAFEENDRFSLLPSMISWKKLFHFLSSYQNCKLAEVVLESRMKIAAIECVGRTGVTGIPLFSLDFNENFTFEAFYCGSQYLFLKEIRKLSVFHSIFLNLSDDR